MAARFSSGALMSKYSRAVAIYRETSRLAWESVAKELSEIDRTIFGIIASRAGATCDEIEVMTGFKHQTAAAQIRHMTEAGLLRAGDEKRPTRSGRKAIVWVLAPRKPEQTELFGNGDIIRIKYNHTLS
jgi:hypothetical protein